MKRFECLQAIAPLINKELVVTSAGGATAEWNAVRPSDGNIQVKTLGLCSSIGLGLALALPNRKVFVFDGDGALWMNLGSLATIAGARREALDTMTLLIGPAMPHLAEECWARNRRDHFAVTGKTNPGR